MGSGTGLDASIGFGQETTYGVPVTPSRWLEFDSETIQRNKKTIQGLGLRGGGLYPRSNRRKISTRDAKGSWKGDLSATGMGLLFKHMLGSSTASNAGAAYTQVHVPGSLTGLSLTLQEATPSIDTVNNPFTYCGGKVIDWDISIGADQLAKLALTFDFQDEQTLANAPAGLAVATAGTAGSTSYYYRVSAVLPAGETGACAEVVIATGNAVLTGTNKNNLTWTAVTGALSYNVYGKTTGAETLMKNVTVTNYSDTGVDAPGTTLAPGPALATPTYGANASAFSFLQATLLLNGTAIAAVKKANVKNMNPQKVDRFYLGGSGLKSEPIGNGWRGVTGALEADFISRAALYDAYAADADLSLQLKFTGDVIASTVIPYSVQIDVPRVKLDGETPTVGGPDVLSTNCGYTGLDDGTNPPVKITYVTSDVAY